MKLVIHFDSSYYLMQHIQEDSEIKMNVESFQINVHESKAYILNGFEGLNACCHAASGGKIWIKAVFKDILVTTETSLIIEQPSTH